uniref:Uncharacterized protein n=1 Tax=Anopheles dirus TaxID=7168 RepID=A0A182NW32_9DIPT
MKGKRDLTGCRTLDGNLRIQA